MLIFSRRISARSQPESSRESGVNIFGRPSLPSDVLPLLWKMRFNSRFVPVVGHAVIFGFDC